MDADLKAYDEAWNNTPKEERNALCERLADEYVAKHPELAQKYGALTIPDLVALVDRARENGDDARRIELDIWINHRYEYQNIGGIDGIYGNPRDLQAVNVAGDRRTAGGA